MDCWTQSFIKIYQDIILTPILTITPNPNSDFENFWLFVKQVIYFQYFGLLRNLSTVGHRVLLNPYTTVRH